MKTAILILAAAILLLNCSSDEPGSQEVILQKIYDNSGGKGDATTITMEDLKTIGLKNLEDARLKQYQNAISTKKDFSNPATVEELQALVANVNSTMILILLNPITPSEEQTNLLNAVFDIYSEYGYRESVTYVIKSTEDLEDIYSGDISATIDFSKYFIIGGHISLPNQPNIVISQDLYKDAQKSMFKYCIEIDNSGFLPAVDLIVYWGIYPLTTITNENVTTTFKFKYP